jgi:HK97 family phage portal protein
MLSDRVAARRGAEVERAESTTWRESLSRVAVGRGFAGVNVTVDRALGVTAWYSGVRYLTDSVAGLPVHTYRDSMGTRTRRADPLWLTAPDDGVPRFSLIEHWMMSLLHRGNAYGFKRRDGMGRVVGLRPIHPDRVKVGRSDDGTKVFKIDNGAFTSREILHIPGLSYDGVSGLDPLSIHRDALGVAAAADEYAGRAFGAGDHLRAYIAIPQTLNEEQANEIKGQWERFHKGMQNAHELGVLGNGAEYRTVGLDPEQTQMLETRQFEVSEVSRMLRVPPHKLYDLSRATFSNIEHQSIEAVVDSIQPWVVRIEAFVNDDPDLLPGRGQFIEFSLEGLLRGDTATRYEAYSKAVGRPWMQGNEARRLENLPPLPELDAVAEQGNAPAAQFEAPQEVAV